MKLLKKAFSIFFCINIINGGKNKKIEEISYEGYVGFIGLVLGVFLLTLFIHLFLSGMIGHLFTFLFLFYVFFFVCFVFLYKKEKDVLKKSARKLTSVDIFNKMNPLKKTTILSFLFSVFHFSLLYIFLYLTLTNIIINAEISIIGIILLGGILLSFIFASLLTLRFIINIMKLTFIGMFTEPEDIIEKVSTKTKTTNALSKEDKEILLKTLKNEYQEENSCIGDNINRLFKINQDNNKTNKTSSKSSKSNKSKKTTKTSKKDKSNKQDKNNKKDINDKNE